MHPVASGILKVPPLREKKHFGAHIFLLNMTVFMRIFSHITPSGDELTGPEASYGAKIKSVLIVACFKHILQRILQ